MASQALTAAEPAQDRKAVAAIRNTQLDAGAPRSMFMPANMGEAMELARLMANSNFVPPHLRGKPGDCLAVVMQSGRWGMDPFAVGNKTYFVSDKMAYEAQLVNAVINSAGVLDGRLQPEWQGEGNDLVCTVSGKIKGDPQVKTRRVAIKHITTRNSPLWKQDPEQQLAYYASRAWARLYAPEVLMGVYTPDELDTAMSTAGAAGDVQEIRPLTSAALLGHGEPANDGTLSAENPSAAEGRDEADFGEDTGDARRAFADDLIARLKRADILGTVIGIEGELRQHRDAMPDELAEEVDAAIADAKARFGKAKQ